MKQPTAAKVVRDKVETVKPVEPAEQPEPAILEPVAKAKEEEPAPAKKGGDALYISRERESHMFTVCGVTSIRDASGHKLMWEVPEEKAEAFSRHHHVMTKRIIKAS